MLYNIISGIFSMGSFFGGLMITLFILSAAVKVVPEYQRLVVFRLGRLAQIEQGAGIAVAGFAGDNLQQFMSGLDQLVSLYKTAPFLDFFDMGKAHPHTLLIAHG